MRFTIKNCLQFCSLTFSLFAFSSGINAQVQNESRLTAVAVETFEPGINDFVPADSIAYSWAQGEGLGSADYTQFPTDFYEWYTTPPISYVNTTNVIKSAATSYYSWENSANQYDETLKNNITLDANGNIVEIFTFQKSGNTWVDYAKQTFTYQNNNRTQEIILISPDGINWENQTKVDFEYYPNGKLKKHTQYQGLLNNQWEEYQKSEYSYSNDNLTETKAYYWDDDIDNWPTNSDYRYLYSYNSNNMCDTLLSLRWSNYESAYGENTKKVYLYNANNQITKMITYDNGNYNPSPTLPADQPFSIKYYTYNFSYLTEILTQKYNDDIDSYENSNLYNFIYDGELLIKNETRKWDEAQSAWVPNEHFHFGRQMKYYYEPIGTAGLSDLEQNMSVELYPNPSADKITIEVEDDFINNIEITNQNGQVVFKNNSELKNKQVTIPVHQLNKGLYYVKISSNKSQAVKSIVVE